MTNANTYLQAAMDNAKQRDFELFENSNRTRKFQGHASGSTATPLGELVIRFIVAESRTTIRPEHMRKSYSLDGKRIAIAKLTKLLDEI